MHRRFTNPRPGPRNIARITLAIAAAVALTGCASSSRTTLGLAQPETGQLSMGVGDALGASMFSEHIRLAAAEARQSRALAREFATVQVQTD